MLESCRGAGYYVKHTTKKQIKIRIKKKRRN